MIKKSIVLFSLLFITQSCLAYDNEIIFEPEDNGIHPIVKNYSEEDTNEFQNNNFDSPITETQEITETFEEIQSEANQLAPIPEVQTVQSKQNMPDLINTIENNDNGTEIKNSKEVQKEPLSNTQQVNQMESPYASLTNEQLQELQQYWMNKMYESYSNTNKSSGQSSDNILTEPKEDTHYILDNLIEINKVMSSRVTQSAFASAETLKEKDDFFENLSENTKKEEVHSVGTTANLMADPDYAKKQNKDSILDYVDLNSDYDYEEDKTKNYSNENVSLDTNSSEDSSDYIIGLVLLAMLLLIMIISFFSIENIENARAKEKTRNLVENENEIIKILNTLTKKLCKNLPEYMKAKSNKEQRVFICEAIMCMLPCIVFLDKFQHGTEFLDIQIAKCQSVLVKLIQEKIFPNVDVDYLKDCAKFRYNKYSEQLKMTYKKYEFQERNSNWNEQIKKLLMTTIQSIMYQAIRYDLKYFEEDTPLYEKFDTIFVSDNSADFEDFASDIFYAVIDFYRICDRHAWKNPFVNSFKA